MRILHRHEQIIAGWDGADTLWAEEGSNSKCKKRVPGKQRRNADESAKRCTLRADQIKAQRWVARFQAQTIPRTWLITMRHLAATLSRRPEDIQLLLHNRKKRNSQSGAGSNSRPSTINSIKASQFSKICQRISDRASSKKVRRAPKAVRIRL